MGLTWERVCKILHELSGCQIMGRGRDRGEASLIWLYSLVLLQPLLNRSGADDCLAVLLISLPAMVCLIEVLRIGSAFLEWANHATLQCVCGDCNVGTNPFEFPYWRTLLSSMHAHVGDSAALRFLAIVNLNPRYFCRLSVDLPEVARVDVGLWVSSRERDPRHQGNCQQKRSHAPNGNPGGGAERNGSPNCETPLQDRPDAFHERLICGRRKQQLKEWN